MDRKYRILVAAATTIQDLLQKAPDFKTALVCLIVLVSGFAGGSRSGYSQTTTPTPLLDNVTDQTQTPIPGAGHDYQHLLGETVNFSNGSVSFKIAFPFKKGRGITLPLVWSYTSTAVNPLDSPFGLPTWDDTAQSHVWPQQDGWNLSEGIPTATAQIWSQSAVCAGACNATVIPCNYQSGMTFTGPDGVTHSLYTFASAPAATNNGIGYIMTCGAAMTQPPTTAIGDGQVVATLNPLTGSQYLANTNFENGPFSVMDKNGTTYMFGIGASASTTGTSAAKVIEAPYEIIDRNGNMVSFTPSFLNTLGLADPTISGMPVNGHSTSVTVTSDNLSFVAQWEPVTVSYTTGIHGGADPSSGKGCQPFPGQGSGTSTVSGNRMVMSSLKLPNNQYYYLYYGSNNPTDSSVENIFGLLNEIVFPDGGWIKYKWELPPASSLPGLPYVADSQYNEEASFGSSQVLINSITETSVTANYPYGCVYQYQEPVLAERQVSFDGATVAQTQTFEYGTAWTYDSENIPNVWTQKTTVVTTTDNIRNLISKTVYNYTPYYPPAQQFAGSSAGAAIPLESSITYYDWGQSTPLKTVQKQWLDQFNLSNETTTYYTGGSGSRVSGRVYRYTNNLCGANQLQFNGTLSGGVQNCSSPNICTNPVSSLVYLTEQDDYDFGNGRLGPLAKKTLYNYTCFNPPFPNSAPPISTLPPQIQGITIEDGTGAIKAATRYSYDAAGSITSLTTNPVQHSTSYTPGPSVRSNLTSVTRCSTLPSSPTASCSGPTTTYTYDYSGQPSSSTDPCGNGTCTTISGSNHTTTYSFVDNPSGGNTNAYLTLITYPDGLQKTFTWNYPLGYLGSAIDENQQTTTYTYNTNALCPSNPDGMNRLSKVQYYPGGELTEYCYLDSSLTATKGVLLSGTLFGEFNQVDTTTVNDGMGHAIQTQQSTDPDGGTFVNTTYDGEGLVFSASNPFRGAGPPSNTTVFQFYDALGRKVETQEQDQTSFLRWSYNGIGETTAAGLPSATNGSSQLGTAATSSRPGTWVDFTDQNGNDWQRTSDVFGNLLEVMEPNGAGQTATMETDYSYDVLDNLTSVVQNGGSSGSSGARRRQFSYDNLSELMSAFNPETGAIKYTFDLNGNVYTKTDARQIITTYGYDSRNRLLSKTYQNDASGTPASCYQYGEVSDLTNFTGGRLINSWTQTTQSCPATPASYLTLRNIPTYDPMGRVKQEQQATLASQATGAKYSPTYGYDLAGNLVSWGDGITKTSTGSGLTFTAQFCGAGRPQTVSSNWSDSTHPGTLFSPTVMPSTTCGTPSTLQYEPFGGLWNAAFGSGLTFSRAYDMKMRVSSELDQGNGTLPATPSSATVTITGAEQSQ